MQILLMCLSNKKLFEDCAFQFYEKRQTVLTAALTSRSLKDSELQSVSKSAYLNVNNHQKNANEKFNKLE